MEKLSKPKDQLVKSLKMHGPSTLAQLVKRGPLAKSTLRQHLEELEKSELVDRRYLKSARGRPVVEFVLTEKAQRLFPSQDSLIFKSLLTELIQKDHQNLFKKVLEEFWSKRSDEFSRRLRLKSKVDLKTRTGVLVELLEEEGFMPLLVFDKTLSGNQKQKLDSRALHECNCPFRETIEVSSLPCQLEKIFLQKALNTEVIRKNYIPGGNFSCSYSFSENKCKEEKV